MQYLADISNAIILVAPDGTFLTESILKSKNIGKVIIDPDFPNQPRNERILDCVNMYAHIARYLGL